MTALAPSAARTGRAAPRALIICNASAKQGSSPVAAALEAFRDLGFEADSIHTTSSEEACEQIRSRAGDLDLVVVAGGDGTLSGVAPALLATGKTLGILPFGTANDLARTLQIPLQLKGAVEVIARGERRRIDLGLANGKPFFNVASVGLAASLARELSGPAKRRYGRLGYAFAALRVLLHARRFQAEIVGGGEAVRVKTFQVAVASGRYHGGGVAVREDARIDDGRLDLYSLEAGSLWKVVAMAPLFRRGRHVRWREVRAARGERFELRTVRPMPVNLDGDLGTCTPLQLEVLPAAIQVFAPARGSGAGEHESQA